MPPVAFFEEILVPLQREVGERWHDGHASPWPRSTSSPRRPASGCSRCCTRRRRRARHHVVCACFPTEDHELGLMGVALKFRHAGWRVTFLGARTPLEHLARVVRAVAPDLVALSAVQPKTPPSLRATLQQLMAALPPKTKVVVGGAAALQSRAVVDCAGARSWSSRPRSGNNCSPESLPLAPQSDDDARP